MSLMEVMDLCVISSTEGIVEVKQQQSQWLTEAS